MVWLLTMALAGAAGPLAAEESCGPQRGFDRGHAGVAAVERCGGGDYLSAWRLGSELAALQREQRELAAAQSGREAAGRNAAARRMRQLGVDIEAIRGVLLLRGIVVQGPSAAAAGSGTDAPRDAGRDSATGTLEAGAAQPEQRR